MFILGTLCLTGLSLTSCSDEDSYDVVGSNAEKVFFDPHASNTQQNEIYNTPAGVFGLAGGAFTVESQYAVDDRTITVTGEVDNSLVESYNKQHGTDKDGNTIVYNALPQDALSAVEISKVKIEPGKSVGDTTLIISVPSEKCTSLTEEYYVVPVRLKVDGQSGGSTYEPAVRDTFNTVYAVIHNAGSDYIYTDGNDTKTCAVVNTPVGTFGGIDAEFNVSVRANNDATFTEKGEIDNSLVAAYNSEHGTSYEALPTDVASKLQITDGTIAAGQLTTSPGLKITDPTSAAKTLKGSYLLALKRTFVYPNGQTAELPNAYVIVETKSSFINDDADKIVGTTGDGKDWKAIDCSSNLDPSTFSNLFSGGWNARWNITSGDMDNATFTVDLGSEKNLCGFYLGGYIVKNYDVQVSKDNKTWTELGSTEGHNRVSGWDPETYDDYNEYVLYGSVSCRYVKFKVNFDTSNWAWSYSSYRRFNELSLFFN